MRLIDADELIVMEYGGIEFVPKEFIDAAPTVESKRGKWIEQYGDMACPFCGFSCDDPYYLGDANYCPDCGAKLEWEE